MKNDKDGGWCILSRHEHRLAHDEILGENLYIEELHGALDMSQLRREYCGLCKAVTSWCGDTRMQAALMKSWPGGSMAARLEAMIKSHKPAQQVSFRALHALPNFAAAGLARWFIVTMKPKLRGLKHLLPDSAKLVRELSLVGVRGSYLTKLDVKDFYLRGGFRKLAQTAGAAFEGSLATLIEDVVFFLLNNQFITSQFYRERLWRAARGTGIGLMMSGELTDWCFWQLLELPFLLQCNLDRWKISRWWRYRDDILILSHEPLDIHKFLRELERTCSIWPIEVKEDEVNQKSIHYLDVRVAVGDEGVSVRPEYKETKLKIFLDSSSAHTPSVHRSWPRMMMSRLQSRCLNFPIHAARLALVNHWVQSGMPWEIANAHMVKVERPKPRLRRWGRKPFAWCVLPYHSVWFNSLRSALRVVNKDSDLLSMAYAGWTSLQIRISWSNFLPSMASRLMSAGGRG